MGACQGSSEDGTVVVCAGDRGNGPGIFASLQDDPANPLSSRTLIRIAGENAGPGGPSQELGTNASGNPLFLTSFDLDARVGVAHFPAPPAGPANDTFVVCFLAAPNAAGRTFSSSLGLWAAQVVGDGSLQCHVRFLEPVLQIGDSLDGTTVTSLGLYDPIAKVGSTSAGGTEAPSAFRMAFRAGTTAGDKIAVATRHPRIQFFRVVGPLLDYRETDDPDAPLRLRADPSTPPLLELFSSSQLEVEGLVADGVTPLLIRFEPPALTSAEQFTADFTLTGGHLASGTLATKLWVFDGTGFRQTTAFPVSPTTPRAYAYLEGLDSELMFDPGAIEVMVNVKLTGQSGDIYENLFRIRRPPIVLVHGYWADKATWSPAFREELERIRPKDFVLPLDYGVKYSGSPGLLAPANYPNTKLPFYDLVFMLAAELRETIESPTAPLRQKWAFTRYDLVCHSQGGLLARMLCASGGYYGLPPFRAQADFYRGRFRRIITINSPHNGTVMPYYLDKLYWTRRLWVLAVLDFIEVLQPKFDPYGGQIRALHDLAVDPEAKFHLIRAAIAHGPSGPEASRCVLEFYLLLLCSGDRMHRVLPHGSGGVDFGSGGGADQYGGGLGGGSIQIQAQRARVDGWITADGTVGGYSGGSGGSVQLVVGLLEGSGTITASGDVIPSGSGGGGGGGGRIAVYYENRDAFTGRIIASSPGGEAPPRGTAVGRARCI